MLERVYTSVKKSIKTWCDLQKIVYCWHLEYTVVTTIHDENMTLIVLKYNRFYEPISSKKENTRFSRFLEIQMSIVSSEFSPIWKLIQLESIIMGIGQWIC